MISINDTCNSKHIDPAQACYNKESSFSVFILILGLECFQCEGNKCDAFVFSLYDDIAHSLV